MSDHTTSPELAERLELVCDALEQARDSLWDAYIAMPHGPAETSVLTEYHIADIALQEARAPLSKEEP